MKTLYLTNKLRKELKKPFGAPILGEKAEIVKKFKKIIKRQGLKKIICVGDYCSSTLPADIKIFDGRIRRNKRVCTQEYFLSCKNPSASIDGGVWEVLKRAIRDNENVFVEGEEDLLVIPCLLLAKNKTGIVYGLPDKGVSLVEVSSKTKLDFRKILRKFRERRFEKIVFGGTFDKLHKGHRYFILMAKYYAKEAIIGLCSDKMVKTTKKDYKKIQSFQERKNNLKNYLRKINLRHKIFKIDDIYGPSIEDKNIEAILLTEETFNNGVKINKRRKEKGLAELNYIILPYILDLKGRKISSSTFRSSS